MSDLQSWVEDPNGDFKGRCTSSNTVYRNIESGSLHGDSSVCASRSTMCPSPVVSQISIQWWNIPGLIFNPSSTYRGAVFIVLYYSTDTRVYGEFTTSYRDINNPMNTSVNTDNFSYPDLCLKTLQDEYAGDNFGGLCAYMVCAVDGYWTAPASEQFTNTCELNKLFQFEVGGVSGGLQTTGINTAIGCFPSTPEGIVTAILRILISISGLVALVVIIASIVTLMLSADNPEKVKESYSKITYAVIGLILIILSVFILRFIGINILNLSHFNV